MEAMITKTSKEFQEIAHCGGKVIITLLTEDGQRKYSIGIEHSSPKPASWFAIYALPQGIPVETVQMGGIGDRWNPPPTSDCFSVFIASDSTSFFGHSCHGCKNYWRSRSAPSRWLVTCPYCGNRGKTHQFLTQGQVEFVKECCKLFNQSLAQDKDGDYSIDMDKVADAVNAGLERPKFYYAEKTQQNEYKCDACGDTQDILGKFGYCSCCGTRNDLQELEQKIIPEIRARANGGGPHEACVKDTASAFDSLAGKYIEQLVNSVPLTSARKNRITGVRFHNIERVSQDINEIFGIDILSGLKADEVEFIKLMFHRRHVYEHKGGEADEKYIEDSGDKTVKIKQALHETQQSANQTLNLVLRMAQNLHTGFHSIFPPEALPLKLKKA